MEIEFRDGEHEIPDYLADIMVANGVETYKLTVDEAIHEANRRMLSRHVDQAMSDIIAQHMTNLESGR